MGGLTMDDLISRQAAIDRLHPDEWGTPDEKWWPEREVGAFLQALPSVQQWIPVSERLPRINQQVLISTNDGNVFAGHRLRPDTLWQVDDWDNKKAWVYDPEHYTDNIDDLPKSEDCAFEIMPDDIFMAVTSLNYNPWLPGVVAWMPFPEPYKVKK